MADIRSADLIVVWTAEVMLRDTGERGQAAGRRFGMVPPESWNSRLDFFRRAGIVRRHGEAINGEAIRGMAAAVRL